MALVVGPQLDETVSVCHKSDGFHITGDTLVGKALEDLLKCRLAYTVLLNAESALFLL